MSRVTCHVSLFFCQSGEAYWWKVCYQRGLPRLVSVDKSAQALTPAPAVVKRAPATGVLELQVNVSPEDGPAGGASKIENKHLCYSFNSFLDLFL